MTRATDSRPWPTPTTIAPPAASRYALPSASQIVEPSARTATGGEASAERRKTLVIGGSSSARDDRRRCAASGRSARLVLRDVGGGLCAPLQVQLGQDRAHVVLDGLVREEDLRR